MQQMFKCKTIWREEKIELNLPFLDSRDCERTSRVYRCQDYFSFSSKCNPPEKTFQ